VVTAWDASNGQELWSLKQPFRGFTADGLHVAFDDVQANPSPPAAGRPVPMKFFALVTGKPVQLPGEQRVSFHPVPPEDISWDRIRTFKGANLHAERAQGTVPYVGGLPPSRLWVGDRGEVVAAAIHHREFRTPTGPVMDSTHVVSTCQPPRIEEFPPRQPRGVIAARLQRSGNTPQLILTFPVDEKVRALGWVGSVDVIDLDRDRVQRTSFSPPATEKDTPVANYRASGYIDSFIVSGRTVIRKFGLWVPKLDPKSGPGSGPILGPVRDPKSNPVPPPPALVVYDLRTGNRRFDYGKVDLQHWVFIGLNADGSRIAVLEWEKQQLQLLHAETGQVLWSVSVGDYQKVQNSQLLFTPDGSRVVLLSHLSREIRVYDVSSGRLVRRLDTVGEPPKEGAPSAPPGRGKIPQGAPPPPHVRQFTPDGRLLVSGTDGPLTVIDTNDWTIRHRITAEDFYIGPGQLSNRFLLAEREMGGREFEVWDLHTGKPWSRFDLKPAGQITACLFTDDGSRLFILSGTVVHVIDLLRGREVLRLPPETGQPAPVTSKTQSHMTLSADGTELTVYTVPMNTGAVEKRVHDGRPLTEEELTRARRILDIQTRPLPPLPMEGPRPGHLSPVTASDYFEHARIVGEPLMNLATPLEVARREQWFPDAVKNTLAAYREAIKLDPDFSLLHGELGRVLNNIGDSDGALREYREAVRLAPRDLVSHFQIGQILERRRDFAGAVEAYREALRHDTRSDIRHAGMGGYGYDGWLPRETLHDALGHALLGHGDLEAAEKELREAIRVQPKGSSDRGPFTNLVTCLIRRGKLKDAETEVKALVNSFEEKALKEPNNPEKRRELAQVNLDVGA
jgi:Flp pilus assembly protein TadD